MKRGKVLSWDDMDGMSTFTDITNRDTLYCLDEANFKKVREVSKKYDENREEVPESEVVKAYIIKKVKEFNEISDLYAIDKVETIDFPIKKITWAWGFFRDTR